MLLVHKEKSPSPWWSRFVSLAVQNIASSCETSVCNDRQAEILSENLPDDRSGAGTLSFVPLLLSQQVVELKCFKHSCIAGEDGLIACLLLDIMF